MSSDFKTVMIEVAQAVASKAKEKDVPFAEAIDALKALTAMYAALQKHPTSEDDKTGEGFDFSKGVEPDEEDPPDDHTVTPIRARRRPG